MAINPDIKRFQNGNRADDDPWTAARKLGAVVQLEKPQLTLDAPEEVAEVVEETKVPLSRRPDNGWSGFWD